MLYLHAFFTGNMAVIAAHKVINFRNAAGRRIFNRQDAITDFAVFYGFYHVFKHGIVMPVNILSRKIFFHSFMAVRTFHAKTAYFKRHRFYRFSTYLLFFHFAGNGHNFFHQSGYCRSVTFVAELALCFFYYLHLSCPITHRQVILLFIFGNPQHCLQTPFKSVY